MNRTRNRRRRRRRDVRRRRRFDHRFKLHISIVLL
jgi:hypothetical protein